MLEELLKEIRAGGTLETRVLAKHLGATPELVEVMLEHLQRAGFIHPYVHCGEGCQGCSLRSACGSQSVLRLWQNNPEQ